MIMLYLLFFFIFFSLQGNPASVHNLMASGTSPGGKHRKNKVRNGATPLLIRQVQIKLFLVNISFGSILLTFEGIIICCILFLTSQYGMVDCWAVVLVIWFSCVSKEIISIWRCYWLNTSCFISLYYGGLGDMCVSSGTTCLFQYTINTAFVFQYSSWFKLDTSKLQNLIIHMEKHCLWIIMIIMEENYKELYLCPNVLYISNLLYDNHNILYLWSTNLIII